MNGRNFVPDSVVTLYMDLFVELAGNEGGDRPPVSVPRPSAFSGVGAALRNSYPALPLSEEFQRLLARIK
jgi:hypothetical protein